MPSKRRRLYEGFGVLEEPAPTLQEETSTLPVDQVENENKLETSVKQNKNNSKTEPKTVLETSLKQNSNEPKTQIEPFRNNSKTEPKTVLETSLKQNSNEPKTSTGLSSVVGLQRKILDYLFLRSQNHGSLNTGKIHTEILAEMLSCSVETVRTSIQRLEKKSFIIRKEFKAGRGGFSVFEIEKSAYQNLVLENNSQTTVKQNSINSKTEPKTEPKTDLANSRSDLKDNKNSTIRIPEEIKTLMSANEALGILEKGLLTEEALQSSLENFAFDYTNGLVKAKTAPINLLYGLLRSGKTYRSVKLIELENQELREYETSLKAVEAENARLKQLGLKDAYEQFKKQNPQFIDEIKTQNKFVADNEELADKVGFSKFLEIQP